MSSLRIILTLLLFFSAISCRTVKKSSLKTIDHTLSTQSHENTSSTRTQLSEQWFRTASSLEHRDGSVFIDFDGPALISIGPDQTIQASGANPTIRSAIAYSRQDTTVERANYTQRIEKDTTSRSEERLEASSEVVDTSTERAQSLTPWIGAGLAIAIVALAVLWFFRGRR